MNKLQYFGKKCTACDGQGHRRIVQELQLVENPPAYTGTVMPNIEVEDPCSVCKGLRVTAIYEMRSIDMVPTFGQALMMLREGLRLQREGWNGKNMYIELQVPDEHSKMTLPYIYMRTAQGDLVPWLASQTDILANDWWVVE